MRIFLFCVSAAMSLGLLAPSVNAIAAEAPISVALEEMLKSPDNFNGKMVRVEGRITHCPNGLVCGICSEDAHHALVRGSVCLGIAFYPYDRAEELVWDTNRFASVVLDARFDASCLKPKVSCTDNASLLIDARVIKIIERHSTLDSKLDYVMGDMEPAGDDDRAEMIEAMNDAGIRIWGDKKLAVFHVANTERYLGITIDGVGCIGDGNWPKQWAINIQSPGNSFRCWQLRKTPRGWRVQVER